jgi:hypothetical protein
LLDRGIAHVDIVDGGPSECADSSRPYFGPEQGEAWVKQVSELPCKWARIAITPTWVGILDYETRLPSALMRAMSRVGV